MVPSVMRGKLAGLFSMSESLGRAICPVGFATTFAWSISSSSYDWVDHKFVFLFAAFSMTVVAILAWGTLTEQNMTLGDSDGVLEIQGRPFEDNIPVRSPGSMPASGINADLV